MQNWIHPLAAVLLCAYTAALALVLRGHRRVDAAHGRLRAALKARVAIQDEALQQAGAIALRQIADAYVQGGKDVLRAMHDAGAISTESARRFGSRLDLEGERIVIAGTTGQMPPLLPLPTGTN